MDRSDRYLGGKLDLRYEHFSLIDSLDLHNHQSSIDDSIRNLTSQVRIDSEEVVLNHESSIHETMEDREFPVREVIEGHNVSTVNDSTRTEYIKDNDNHKETGKSENLFLIQWNCNGFYKKFGEFQKLAKDYEPSVICVQETLLRKGKIPSFKGYKSFCRSSSVNPGERVKGGVVVLVKDDVNAVQLTVSENVEIVAVRINYPRDLTVCSLYRTVN